jgi:hypothetical protein
MFVLLLVFLLLDILAFPYETRSMMRLSLLWNSIALLFFMADSFVFKSLSSSDELKLIFSVVMISLFAILVILSFVRLYQSKVSKIKHREFDAKISNFNMENSCLQVQFQTDTLVVEAYKSEELLNSKIKESMEWRGDFSKNRISETYNPIISSALTIPTAAMPSNEIRQSSTRTRQKTEIEL